MTIERDLPRPKPCAASAPARVLVDVRESHERATGFAEGARGIARAELEADPQAGAARPRRRGAADLPVRRRARCRPRRRWQAAGYSPRRFGRGRHHALDRRRPAADAARKATVDFYDRYSRHLRLPEVGEAGQRRLQAARVAMVGAGGLGSPAAFYLAAAGVGTLVLADDDVVDRSNLQRQILHTEARIGVAKVESARIALSALNPTRRASRPSPSASPPTTSNA